MCPNQITLKTGIPFQKIPQIMMDQLLNVVPDYEARKGTIKGYCIVIASLLPWIQLPVMPNRKTDTTTSFGFSTDYIGRN